MKNLKIYLSIGLATVHNVLFWNEILAANMLIFSVLFCVSLVVMFPACLHTRKVNYLLFCVGLTALALVVYNSDISKCVHIASLVVLVGFVHQKWLKTVYMAVATAIASLAFVPATVRAFYEGFIGENKGVARFTAKLKLTVLPFVGLAVFYWIYKLANPRFDSLTNDFWMVIWDSLAVFFENFSFWQVLMFVAVLWLMLAALYNPLFDFFVRKEKSFPDFLALPENAGGQPVIALKNEYSMALLLVAMVNALLLIVNIIDIEWIWFSFDPASVENLSQFVHEGTYLLIASILLSMALMLYFFRSGINFYPNNKTLKYLSYTWMLQNVVMAVSVGLRNFHYIAAFNLTYKRIGVGVFLILTVVGLLTLWIKIKERRTAMWLINTNSWAVYTVFVLLTLVDWDIHIVNYNLKYGNLQQKDPALLLTFSDKTLPLLLEHKAAYFDGSRFEKPLMNRIYSFNKRYGETSWLSWNLAEYEAFNKLKNVQLYGTVQ